MIRHCEIKIASTLRNTAQCHMPFVPNTKQKKFIRTKNPGCAECIVTIDKMGRKLNMPRVIVVPRTP